MAGYEALDPAIDPPEQEAQTERMSGMEAFALVSEVLPDDYPAERWVTVFAALEDKKASLSEDLSLTDPWRVYFVSYDQSLQGLADAPSHSLKMAIARQVAEVVQRGWMMLQFERDSRNQSSAFPQGSGNKSKRLRFNTSAELERTVEELSQ